MRVLIAGAGAVGSLFGARLSLAGHQLTLVARGHHLSAMQTRGLDITGVLDVHVRPHVAASFDRDMDPECVLLTCKTFDLDLVATSLAQRVRPALTVALENGLGIQERLVTYLEAGGWHEASRWATTGINSVPATLAKPGVVRQAGEGELLLPGANVEPPPPRGLDALAGALQTAGIPCRRVDDFERQVWRKLLVNAAINPVTADHGVANGALADDPWRGQTLVLLEEARAVAGAEGFAIPREEAEADLWRVVRSTAANRSSMLQDLERGRPTEIDAISGELVRRGRRHGLSLPATERVLDRISRRSRTVPD